MRTLDIGLFRRDHVICVKWIRFKDKYRAMFCINNEANHHGRCDGTCKKFQVKF